MKVYIFLIFSISLLHLTAETIVLSTHFQEYEEEFRYVEQYYNEVAANIDGLDIVMRYLPLERSIYFLERGEIDGDAARAKFLYDDYENVLRVDTPILTMDYIFLSPDPLPENIPEDLSDGRVLVNRGALSNIKYLESHGIPYSVVTSSDLGLKMLINRRAKYYFCPIFITNFLEDNSNKYNGIHISDTVYQLDVYLFLHKHYEKWIPELKRVIKMLSDSGQNLELLGYR